MQKILLLLWGMSRSKIQDGRTQHPVGRRRYGMSYKKALGLSGHNSVIHWTCYIVICLHTLEDEIRLCHAASASNILYKELCTQV